jgi:hypothetical protein
MKYFLLGNYIEVSVDDSYPWFDTLGVNSKICKKKKGPSENIGAYIQVEKVNTLSLKDVRSIGSGYYIGENIYVDKEYGVRLERIAKNRLKLQVTQECNEWISITMELMFLQQDKTLIHAAGLEKDNEVLLFPSWGGVGKTATVCRYVNEYGWRLLGDDLVLVDKDKAEPLLKPFVIYPYHKDLFPQIFASGSDKHIVKNIKVSNMMSKAIPTVKRLTRPFPRLLAFMRKHNPQSLRVSPYDLFYREQLSKGGKVKQIVWLERTTKDTVNLRKCQPEEIASKMATVSAGEIFAAKLDCVFQMIGCGMFSYNETFGKLYGISLEVCDGKECAILEIPQSIAIDKVAEVIYQTLK